MTYHYTFRITNCNESIWAQPSESFSLGLPTLGHGPGAVLSNDTAMLHADLVEGHPANLVIFWGENGGGTNRAAWDQMIDLGVVGPGSHSSVVSGLPGCVPYSYRAYASNHFGESWAPAATVFQWLGPLVGFTGMETSELSDVHVRLENTLIATGTVARASLYYGPTDGGTTPGAWSHQIDLGWHTDTVVRLSHTIGGLSSNTMLFYTFRAENCSTDIWTPPSTVTTRTYTNRMKISFCTYTGTSRLTNFPALVQLGHHIRGFDYVSFSSPSGGDLRFYDATETSILQHEIELWDTDGTSHVWVEVPALENRLTHIYAKWGSSATNPPAYTTNGATWSANFRGVWHLGESVADETSSAAIHQDSSTNAFHANQQNNVSASGFIGNGQSFDGDNDRIWHSYTPSLNPVDITVSCWAWVQSQSGFRTLISSRRADFSPLQGYSLYHENDPRWSIFFRSSTGFDIAASPAASTPLGQWVHVAASYDAALSRGRLFINGRLEADQNM
ncbi:MAG: DUF2341 domain-containing protein, partial [Verrucomicrobiota bacterium]